MTHVEMEQFIAEYGADIYSFCCRLTGSRQEADDLYQETFLKAVEKQKHLSRSILIWPKARKVIFCQ